ncbi:uncharacterized protein LOC100208249 isoform X1 [Hydra vulgaris]|uniref:uncharacterized protein LOC100208249 isoform X1 n=1 Tax=Hydra vulgaris TaxID=6087 RepID=UPI00019256DE|nr:uncharacterized protein LOC100208249 [Hydra vulgaris]
MDKNEERFSKRARMNEADDDSFTEHNGSVNLLIREESAVKDEDQHTNSSNDNGGELYEQDVIQLVKHLHQTVKELSNENAQLKKRIATMEVEKEHKMRLNNLNNHVKRFIDVSTADQSFCSHTDCAEISSEDDSKPSMSMLIRQKKLPLCKYDYSHEVQVSDEYIELAETVRSRSVSHKNFAKNLLQEIYKDRKQELVGKNTRGKRGKAPLPKDIVEIIKSLVWRFYPNIMDSPIGETEWELCIAAIDEFLRRKKSLYGVKETL